MNKLMEIRLHASSASENIRISKAYEFIETKFIAILLRKNR